MTKAEKENTRVFRGLGVRGRDKGKWIYGQIVAMSDCEYIAEQGADELSSSANRKHKACEEVQIDPSTLSEWTGYLDCTGNKIFEGDIYEVNGWGRKQAPVGIISEWKPKFYGKEMSDKELRYFLEISVTVVGNIFETKGISKERSKEGVMKKKGEKTQEIKPCPFCGGKAHEDVQYYHDETEVIAVKCFECETRTGYWSGNDAVEHWNTRTSEKTINKKSVLEMIHALGGCGADDERTKGWDDAIDHVYHHIDAFLKEESPEDVPDTNVGNKWHKYPDEKPEEQQLYFVFLYNEIDTMHWRGKSFDFRDVLITHWQEIPKPQHPPEEEAPKEGEPPLHIAYVPQFQEDEEAEEEKVVHYYNCPRCQKCISNKSDETIKFCAYCGQQIDWTSTQEVE